MKVFQVVIILLSCWVFPSWAQSQNITVSLNYSPAYCQSGYKDGRIFSKVTGGTTPYTYLWSNGKTKPNLDSLTAGKYSLTVTDAVGLSKTVSGDVTQSKGLSMTANLKGATCDGMATGSVFLNNPNSHAPHTFIWSNAATTQNISNLATGFYTVTATDKFGCSSQATYEIKKELEFDVNPLGPPCANFIVFGVSNEKGTPPYTYLWSNGLTGQTITTPPLPFQPIYNVTVTDSKGCSKSKDAPFFISTSQIVSQTIKPTDCDKADGAISLNFDFEPISFKWSTGAITKNISGLKPVTYTLTVTSPASCISIFSFNVLGNIDVKITPEIVCNATSGTLTASVVKGGIAPYQYVWSNGSNSATINSAVNIVNTVTVTDVKGCRAVKQSEVLLKADKLIGSLAIDTTGCPALKSYIKNGIQPFLYKWSNGLNTSEITLVQLKAGNYTVTVIDANGCTGIFPITITSKDIAPKFLFDIKICGNSASFIPKCSTTDFSYLWDNNATINSVKGLSVGKHFITITENKSKIKYIDSILIISNLSCSYLQGTVNLDTNNNCLVDTGEMPLTDEIIEILPGPFFTKTDQNGAYTIMLPSGNYTVNVQGENLLEKPCQLAIPVNVVDTTTLNIPMKVAFCPFMEVYVSTPFLRRCFDNNYVVGYCNKGVAVAKNASIKLELDKYFIYKNASIPLASQNANTLIFNVGDVAPNECRSFIVTINLDCNAALGQTHCMKAKIFPDSLCLPSPPAWSGAKVETKATCNGNEVVLTIENTSDFVMSSNKNYIIIEEQVIYKQGNFKLNPKEKLEFKYPANGKMYRIEAEQENAFPLIPSNPSAWVEACGTNPQGGVSTGFVSQFGHNGATPFEAIDCKENRGAYDPNEKQAYPIGYDKAHFINQNQNLEYTLHFQNEGTDTAFTVVLRDTLSKLLNISTLRMGASSHPYTWNLSDKGILSITFNNIHLTAKKENEEKSKGFVKFHIAQQKDLPLNSLIQNRAGIYFDFNTVILTNTVFHTVGKNFISIKSNNHDVQSTNIQIYPNPSDDVVNFDIENIDNQAIELNVYDLGGKLLRSETHTAAPFSFHREALPSGVYVYQIRQKGLLIGQGRMSIF
jgi:uncharacterized repeat protein (TIGR01451 family)